MIYNRVYSVPVWISANLSGDDAVKFGDAFDAAEALVVPWPSDSYPLTVAELGGRGWGHEVNKPMPFFVSLNFLHFAITKHLTKALGLTASLSGQPTAPYSVLDRKVQSGDDHARLFNDVLSLETDVALSRLFSIGDLCHMEGKKQFRVFVSTGKNIPTKLLQRIAGRVITVGGAGSDIVAEGRPIDEVIQDTIDLTASFLGIK
jgi:hypothetical protein